MSFPTKPSSAVRCDLCDAAVHGDENAHSIDDFREGSAGHDQFFGCVIDSDCAVAGMCRDEFHLPAQKGDTVTYSQINVDCVAPPGYRRAVGMRCGRACHIQHGQHAEAYVPI